MYSGSICTGKESFVIEVSFIRKFHFTCIILSLSHYTGASPIGINPKINNIFDAYQSAQYNLLWLSDSNILGTYNVCVCLVVISIFCLFYHIYCVCLSFFLLPSKVYLCLCFLSLYDAFSTLSLYIHVLMYI